MVRKLFQALIVVLGSYLVSLAYNGFFMPYELASGGLAGIALLLAKVLHWPVGLQVMLYNIPILWWAWRDLGRKFLVLTIVGIASLTFFTSIIPVKPIIADEPILNAIFGGIVAGAGIGIALRAGGSLGGLDVAAVAFHRRFSIAMGDVMLAFNAGVVALAGFTGDLKIVLYTLMAMFATAKLVDLITAGAVKKTMLVVTAQAEAVARRINEEMGRGVTMLPGVGAYSGEQRTVLLCVVTRFELSQVREIAGAIDPNAFAVVLDTDQVMGRFRSYNLLTRTATPLERP